MPTTGHANALPLGLPTTPPLTLRQESPGKIQQKPTKAPSCGSRVELALGRAPRGASATTKSRGKAPGL